jgi:glycine/D-amino acid oxidase-like deaminating enzyme/nitrite reductase/ring-hydroxylating ferredoxin subunit
VARVDVRSYWLDSAEMPAFQSLDRHVDVNVVVVGAGITGLTAAYLLKRAGKTVAVLERDRIGGVDTMNTTAHVTCVTDLDLTELDKTFGRDHAQAAWDAGLAAIDQLDTVIREESIECGWKWVTGYKHVAANVSGEEAERETQRLRDEASLAESMGFDATFTEEIPWLGRPGIAFDGQARIHPRKYLARLARIVDDGSSFVFEGTSCDEVTESPAGLKITSGPYTIHCQYLVLATHTPLMGKTNIASATLLQTKLYLYTSYVIGGRLPSGIVPEALFWDTADPYHYVRVDRQGDHDYLIIGGEDHKTGQIADTKACFRRLEAAASRLVPGLEITHRWSGQVVETNDGLPFIGETSKQQFAATGYAGNGMTFGTLAGMMARDAALGLKNPWQELFDVGRTKVKGGAWDYLKENIDYPYYLVRDRFAGAESRSLRALRPGEGGVLSLNGQRVAAFRAADGSVSVLSPICTHMGCVVGWNTAEQTWDCPCHGSRFKATGEVLSGPAESPLPRLNARDLSSSKTTTSAR